jgi:hypothetical protein
LHREPADQGHARSGIRHDDSADKSENTIYFMAPQYPQWPAPEPVPVGLPSIEAPGQSDSEERSSSSLATESADGAIEADPGAVHLTGGFSGLRGIPEISSGRDTSRPALSSEVLKRTAPETRDLESSEIAQKRCAAQEAVQPAAERYAGPPLANTSIMAVQYRTGVSESKPPLSNQGTGPDLLSAPPAAGQADSTGRAKIPVPQVLAFAAQLTPARKIEVTPEPAVPGPPQAVRVERSGTGREPAGALGRLAADVVPATDGAEPERGRAGDFREKTFSAGQLLHTGAGGDAPPAAAGPRLAAAAPGPSSSLAEVLRGAAQDTLEPARSSLQGRTAHDISLLIQGHASGDKRGENIELRVAERAGTVQVGVRASDQQLASSLQEQLGDLVTRLEEAGYSTRLFTQQQTLQPEHLTRTTGEGDRDSSRSFNGQNPSGGQPGQRERGQQEEPAAGWVEAFTSRFVDEQSSDRSVRSGNWN